LKGLAEVRALIARAGQERFRFTLFGKCAEPVDGLAVQGEYEYENVVRTMRDAGVEVLLLFSRAAETYSYTLTEAVRACIPVIVNDAGALPERVEALGGGWVVDARDTGAVLLLLERLRAEPELLAAVRGRLEYAGLPSLGDWGASYARIYAECLSAARPPTRRAHSSLAAARFALLEALQLERDRARVEEEREQLEQRLSSLERSFAVRLARRVKRNRPLAAVLGMGRGVIERFLF
jgi:glycosyltransferase involved in cell wall biosynthesis